MNFKRFVGKRSGDESIEQTTLRLYLHEVLENTLCAYLSMFEAGELDLPTSALSELAEKDPECRRLQARCRIALDRVRDRLQDQPELSEEVINLAYCDSERADRLALLAFRLGVMMAAAPVDA